MGKHGKKKVAGFGGISAKAAPVAPASSSDHDGMDLDAQNSRNHVDYDSLIAQAEDAVDKLEWETAASLYEDALAARPTDLRALDSLGEVAFQMGDAERAIECFTRSIAAEPGGPNFTRYMYLGQLAEGADAAGHYARGIESLKALVAEAEAAASSSSGAAAGGVAPGDRLRLLRRELSKAYCSLAELYMTDLCDEDDAEALCEQFATAGVEADGACAEALRVLADLRLCQKRPGDSLPLITRSVELMEACYPPDEDEEDEDEEEDGEGNGRSSSSGGGEVEMGGAPSSSSASSSSSAGAADTSHAVPALLRSDPLAALPSYDSRLRAAQIAMEVEAYEPAVTVLGRLLGEDDSDMQVWFLLGEALHMGGDSEGAAERLETAEGMLSAAIARVVASARAALKAGKHGGSRGAGGGGGGAGVIPGGLPGANEGLMQLSRGELEAQRGRIRELLGVVRAALQQQQQQQQQAQQQ